MSKRSPSQASKKQVQEQLAKIGATLDPRRVFVTNVDGLQGMAFKVHYGMKSLAFPTLREILVWAHNPQEYKVPDPNKAVDEMPAHWIMDEVKDPVPTTNVFDATEPVDIMEVRQLVDRFAELGCKTDIRLESKHGTV